MRNISIEIVDSGVDVPSHLKAGGRIFLDVDGGVRYETEEVSIELNDSGRNVVSASYSMDVPDSAVNRIVLGPLIDPHVINQTFSGIECRVMANGVLQKYNNIYVEDVVDGRGRGGRRFRVVLDDINDHPLRLLQDIGLNEISDGTFILNKDNVEANWLLGKYEDGGVGYRWGVDWFGWVQRSGKITAEDLRPRWSLLFLIREGLKLIDYDFESDLLEDDFWRNQFAYLSDQKYGGNEKDNLDRYKFLARFLGPLTLNNLRLLGQSDQYRVDIPVVIDNANRFLFGASWYSAPATLIQEVIVEFEVDLRNVNEDDFVRVSLEYLDASTQLGKIELVTLAEERIELVEDITVFNRRMVATVDRLYKESFSFGVILYLRIDGPDSLIINEIKWYNEPIRLRYIEGSIIPMGETLSGDVSVYDLLLGVQHLTGGMLEVDELRQVIRLKPSFDVDVFGNSIEGYYKTYPKGDITKSIQCFSKKTGIPDRSQGRRLRYGFKKSTDEYVKKKNEFGDSEVQPYDKYLNLGSEYEDRLREDRNVLFEPTLLGEVEVVSAGNTIHLSYLVDNLSNDDPKVSYKIGPRVGIYSGKKKQTLKDQLGVVIGDGKLKWYDEEILEFPIYYQDLNGENFDLDGADLTEVLVYGERDNDLWSLYLKKRKIIEVLSQKSEFDIWMNPSEKDLIEMDREYVGKYMGEFIAGFIQGIKYDHKRGSGKIILLAPVETSQFYENLLGEVDVDYQCSDNKPELLHQSGATEIFSLGGVNVFPIEDLTYEVRDVDDNGEFTGSWTLLTTTVSNTAEYANPLKRHQVRMTVEYSEVNGVKCGNKVLILEVDPCGNYTKPELEVGFDAVRGEDDLRRINLVNSVFYQTVSTITAKISRPTEGETSYTIDPVTLLGEWVEVDKFAFPNITLTQLDITFANGCGYSLQGSIINTEFPTVLVTIKLLDGEIALLKKGVDQWGGEYVPTLGTIVLSQKPEEVRYVFKNDEYPDGATWNPAMGPVGKNPFFRVAFHFAGKDEVLYTDWKEGNV